MFTCNPQSSLEHVKGRPRVIVVKLQQRVVFKKSRSPAAGISLQRALASSTNDDNNNNNNNN